MPNNVTNKIMLHGDPEEISKMLEAIQDEEHGIGSIDFNKVIPMPASLDIESSSNTDKGYKAVRDLISQYMFDHKTTSAFLEEIEEEEINAFLSEHKDITDEIWDLGKAAYENVRNYGFPTWYEWSINNWGTKWNSYGYNYKDTPIEKDQIWFMSAWSAAHTVIKELSNQYPTITFDYLWADEDIGNNCGAVRYKSGLGIFRYIPTHSMECIEFAAGVMDADPKDWGLRINIPENDYIFTSDINLEITSFNGAPALYSPEILEEKDFPRGLNLYFLEKRDNTENFTSITSKETQFSVGTLILNEKLELGESNRINLTSETSPVCNGKDYIYLDDFLSGNFEEIHEESEQPRTTGLFFS